MHVHAPIHGSNGLLVIIILCLHRAQEPPGLRIAGVALALGLQG